MKHGMAIPPCGIDFGAGIGEGAFPLCDRGERIFLSSNNFWLTPPIP